MGMSQNSRGCHLSKRKAPAGASHPGFTFSEFTWRVEKNKKIRY